MNVEAQAGCKQIRARFAQIIMIIAAIIRIIVIIRRRELVWRPHRRQGPGTADKEVVEELHDSGPWPVDVVEHVSVD